MESFVIHWCQTR